MICLIILGIYFFAPEYLRVVLFLVNIFLPDEVPLIDELIMLAGLLKK